MNHFDDRASYFAYLREQGRVFDMLDNNAQQDRSMCAYGPSAGSFGQPLVLAHDFAQEV